MRNLYTYDDESRIDHWHGTLEYLSNGTTHSAVVGQQYDYLDYSSKSLTGIGELDQLTVLEAGLSRQSTISYVYDDFYRLTEKTLDTAGALSIKTNYTFRGTSYKTSMLVSNYATSIKIGDTITDSSSYSYTYNVDGNITEVVYGTGEKIIYKYDDLGQLTREDNGILGETYVYTYNNGGNRTSKVTYAYTEDALGTPIDTDTYTYPEDTSTSRWNDQLTEYNGTEISYDAIGNPTTFNGYALTWHGRQLKEMEKSDSVIKFLYNADGIRTVKEVNNVEHIYTLNGTQIVSEAWGDNLLIYLYDESGSPIGLQYRTSSYGTDEFDTFYFEKNLQGDIVAVYNTDGDKIGSYTYDAWGICTVNVVLGSTTLEKSVVQTYNPFRYRGYYYDTETQLYYLQSRYYNPAWGRFLNADGYVNANGDLIGFNMYAYCSNNPVMGYDPTGEWDWGVFADVLVNVIALAAGITVGAVTAIAVADAGGSAPATIAAGIATGTATFGSINNAVNAIYYELSDGETDITNSSYLDGYVSRWERLDYTKMNTGETHYNLNAWRYNSEYSVHMYGWFLTGWAKDKGIPIISEWAIRFETAEIESNSWDDRWYVNLATAFLGLLGG